MKDNNIGWDLSVHPRMVTIKNDIDCACFYNLSLLYVIFRCTTVCVADTNLKIKKKHKNVMLILTKRGETIYQLIIIEWPKVSNKFHTSPSQEHFFIECIITIPSVMWVCI